MLNDFKNLLLEKVKEEIKIEETRLKTCPLKSVTSVRTGLARLEWVADLIEEVSQSFLDVDLERMEIEDGSRVYDTWR